MSFLTGGWENTANSATSSQLCCYTVPQAAVHELLPEAEQPLKGISVSPPPKKKKKKKIALAKFSFLMRGKAKVHVLAGL